MRFFGGLVLTVGVLCVVCVQGVAAATLTVSGSVACRGGNNVEGVWVESTKGGSKWATTAQRSNARWVANYSATISTGTPTKVRLHVGCGRKSDGNWWSNNRSGHVTVGGSAKISMICKEAAGTATRCAPWPAQALVGMPFTGYWDRFGYAPPASHPRSSSNWATDIYQAPGTAVRAKVFVPTGVPLALKVASVRAACGTAGKTVQLDVYRAGTRIGYISFGHLKSIPTTVKAGASLSQDQLLGHLSTWPKSSCWQVSTTSGVHTHVAAYSYGGFACFAPWASKQSLPAGRWIGTVGATNATRPQQICS